jgi:hypothetical protein
MSDSSGLPRNGTKELVSEELLSGLLDGELELEDQAKVSNLVSSEELWKELFGLHSVGKVLNLHLAEVPKELNLWQEIEGKLTPKVPIGVPERKIVEQTESRGFFKQIFRPSFAGVLAIGLFAIGMASSEWVELPKSGTQVAKAKIKESNLVSNKEEILVPLIPNNRPSIGAQTFVSNGGSGNTKIIEDGFSYSPQFISPQQLGTDRPSDVPGVRAGGVEIEWMKNSKQVRILRHKNESIPPVLWVGELR